MVLKFFDKVKNLFRPRSNFARLSERSPAALLALSRTQQKSFRFLLPACRSLGAGGEEKNRARANQKMRRKLFCGVASVSERRRDGVSVSLKEISRKVYNIPHNLICRGSSGVEQATENRCVGGPIPPLGTNARVSYSGYYIWLPIRQHGFDSRYPLQNSRKMA